MPAALTSATAVLFPAQCGIARTYPSTQLADAFAIQLPDQASRDPEVLARFMFSHQPAWIAALMRVRDSVVARLGLKTGKHLASLATGARAARIGIFKIYSRSDTEIIVGEDDRHLDFRVAILCTDAQLTVATVVHCHNLLGRTYLLVIAPFHRMVVKASLRRAAKLGWPVAGTLPA